MGRKKGFAHSEETKGKMSRIKKLTNFSPSVKFLKGHMVSPEIRKKISQSLIGVGKGRHNSPKTEFKKGLIVSEIEKQNRSQRAIGKNNPYYGKKHGPEIISKMKEKRRFLVLPKKDTSIEVKVQNLLSLLNIDFLTHKYISEITHSYQCDIFIPSTNTIIECDGDYWHGNTNKYPKLTTWQVKQKMKDAARTRELREKGYNVVRLWETDIKNISLEKLKSKLLNNN